MLHTTRRVQYEIWTEITSKQCRRVLVTRDLWLRDRPPSADCASPDREICFGRVPNGNWRMPVRSCPVPLTPLSTRVPSSEGPWSRNFRHLLLVIFLVFINPQRDIARRHLRRCQFAFISHSERPFQYKQHLNCSNLGLSHHTPLLLPKQGCGLSSTIIFLRCLHSCRNVNSDEPRRISPRSHRVHYDTGQPRPPLRPPTQSHQVHLPQAGQARSLPMRPYRAT